MTRVRYALTLATLAAAAVVSAACNDSLPSVPQRTVAYAVFAAQRSAAGDAYVLRTSAFFFRSNSLNLLQSGNAPDRCENRAWAPLGPGVSDTLPAVTYLDAGSTVALETSAGTTASLLAQVDAFGKKFYAPQANAPVSPFTPGDVVTLTVPGASGSNSFPQIQLSQRTVEPFTFGDVATASNEPSGGLKLTWTPPAAPPTGTAPTGMLVSLRYALVGSGSADHELFCSVKDDGEFIVPIDDAAPWFNSQTSGHQVQFTRWRGELKQVGNVYTQLISTLIVPTPTAQ